MIAGEMIIGTGDCYFADVTIYPGVTVVAPGFIDPHAHVESSCVTPPDFDLCTLSTTLETPTHS